MVINITTLDIALSRLRSFTARSYGIAVQKNGNIDQQLSKLKGLTSTVLEDTEKKLQPTIMHFFQLILDNIDMVGVVVDANCNILYSNSAAIKAGKMVVAKKTKFSFDKCFLGNDDACKQCHAKEALENRQVLAYSFTGPDTKNCYDVVAVPMRVNSMMVAMIVAVRRL